MPWLVRDGKVLATVEVATSVRERTRGLLGRDGIDGAILLQPARSVHTFRMRFAIDVAFCDRDLTVLRVTTLRRNRIARPVLKAHSAIESEAGTMARWGVRVGDRLDIRGLDGDEAVIDVRDRGPAPGPRPTGDAAPAGPDPAAAPGDVPAPAAPPADAVVDGDGGPA